MIFHLHFQCLLYKYTSVRAHSEVEQSWLAQTVWPDSNTGRPDRSRLGRGTPVLDGDRTQRALLRSQYCGRHGALNVGPCYNPGKKVFVTRIIPTNCPT